MVDGIWLEMQRQLRAALSETDFRTWIAPLRVAAAWERGEVRLDVPSTFCRDWLKRHYLGLLERAAATAAGRPITLRFNVDPSVLRDPQERTTSIPSGACPPQARYTFDSFVVGESNRVAFNAALSVVDRPGTRYNPLFVYGGVGLGKTHLLGAISAALADKSSSRVELLPAEMFVNELIASLRRDQMGRFRQRFRRIDTLIVDDVQFLAGKVRSQEEFIHTFNTLHDGRKQIVLASDRPPHELCGIGETLRNRLAAGLLADVHTPDPALRRALVQQKAAALGLDLPTEVLDYLAVSWCSNVRDLEGALTRLDAFRSLAERPLTLKLAREALAPCRRPGKADLTMSRIVDEVCNDYGLTRDDLRSVRRTARLAEARQVAMYLCRERTDASLLAIGAELGGRDHTTVLYAIRQVKTRLESSAELRTRVSTLVRRVG